ncbi:MAG: S41 family peptidase, partial [Acidobacteria bacterium]|nr:S41 family peptidase [Acidobacteriota bacterium]
MTLKYSRPLFSALLVSLFIALSMLTPPTRPQAVTDERIAYERLTRHYVQGMELIRENFFEQPDYEVLTRTAIAGMLRTLDPHSNFYDKKSFEETRNDQRSQYYGIGSSIQQRLGGVYIMEPFKDTPAARAGLRYGDLIVAIDDKNTEKWNSDQVRDNLRGELGTEVKITVKRAGLEKPLVVMLERGAVDLPSISNTFIVKSGIGYIALSRGFHSTTSDELGAAIASLKEQGMQQLVLDLRGNPGGFLEQAIRVADKFLQRGQSVVSVREREGRATERNRDYAAESGAPEAFPLTILIDEGTASASEIVAGAMQDHDRALIVGENSFGKGLVQTIFNLPEGCGLTLTTARYYTPSGRLIQRDYSNGSIYEYHFRRNANGEVIPPVAEKRETRKTDLGRPVYGGGGIEPDVTVASATITQAQFNLWTSGLFMFVRELVAGRVKGFEQFKREGVDFDHQPVPNEFAIGDDVLKAYEAFMTEFIAKSPEAGVTKELVDQSLDFARGKIREEVLMAAYGQDMMRRMQIL